MSPERIAVIGGGAAGLTAAYLLQEAHEVTLFEREGRLGGHALTVSPAHGTDAGVPLDVAFMVFNEENYPTFCRLLARLGDLQSRPSEMSFGYQSPDAGIQYALNWRPDTAQGASARSAPLLPDAALLSEILRFFRRATRDLADASIGDRAYGDYLLANCFSERFIDVYAIPMGAALWSSSPRDVLACPAAFVLNFYRHHGMLSLDEGPEWRTLVGGSGTYVAALRAALRGEVVTGTAATGVSRDAAGVKVGLAGGGERRFDAVVLATHADEALALLTDPSEDERRLLGAWRYQTSQAVLHSDPTVMPRDRRAWASWNYVQTGPHADAVAPTLTYHLDRLQGQEGLSAPYFLTLNPARAVDPVLRHAEFTFRHPVFSPQALGSRVALAAASGSNATHYCGSYFGYGFHEDAVRAGAAVAAAFGVDL